LERTQGRLDHVEAFHPRADGRPNERLPGEFRVFNGSFANFGVNVPQGFSVTGLNVNKDGQLTGVTMRGNVIGSRLPVERYEKVDPDKLRR
jgi:hypothetical protein